VRRRYQIRHCLQLLHLSFNNVHIHDCIATSIIKRTCLFLITGCRRFILIVIQFRWIYFDIVERGRKGRLRGEALHTNFHRELRSTRDALTPQKTRSARRKAHPSLFPRAIMHQRSVRWLVSYLSNRVLHELPRIYLFGTSRARETFCSLPDESVLKRPSKAPAWPRKPSVFLSSQVRD